jgi:hypothetical protein
MFTLMKHRGLKRVREAVLTLVVCATSGLLGGERDGLWKAVEAAIQQGLPQSAITNLNAIIPSAMKDKAHGETARATLRKVLLEGTVQGNKPEEKIRRLEAEIPRAPAEIQPLLCSVQAHWYWHYYQQNRWRFLNRSATASAPGPDFTTWDLPRLFLEIDRQFNRSLANPARLQAVPITQLDDFLQRGTMPDAYRPTLYDFLVHEALSFYMSGEQAGARAEDAPEWRADQLVHGVVSLFGTVEEFLAGKIERSSRETNSEKAMFLLRDLLIFHQRDREPTARAHADLVRLRWAYNIATGDEKTGLYRKALERFAKEWADHEIAAEALHDLARAFQGDENPLQAHQLASRGAGIHPKSKGAELCRNLLREIEARSLSLSVERVWSRPWPSISVQYRNLTNVYFRVVAYDWHVFLERDRSRPESLSERERAELLSKAPVLTWNSPLPATADYRERIEQLPAPESLKPGFYFLLASARPDFEGTDNQVFHVDFWVSDLALVLRSRPNAVEGFVLDGVTGEPLAGAEVVAWDLNNARARVKHDPLTTDELGFFSIPKPERGRGVLLRARHQGRELATREEVAHWVPEDPQNDRLERRTYCFTDRAIYRPGQTIQYKGVSFAFQQSTDKYAVLSGTELSVVFADGNGKEIARRKHRGNDYGSFSGSFTAPRDRLMGQMQIRVEGGPVGSAFFRVEEYKRPKFQVTLEAPKIAPRLEGDVAVDGVAESYTGAPVDAATVKWRVVREVQWPSWWGWWGWRSGWRGEVSQEIAHGVTRTGADGRFKVDFRAKPDRSISPTNEPTFQFTIHTDVTDAAGETRSAERRVRVGYSGLELNAHAETWQVEDGALALHIRTSTLDGEGQPAEGVLKIHRLKEPADVMRGPLGEPWMPWGRGQGGGGTGAHVDLSDPNQWELGPVIHERGFTTDAKGAVQVEVKLKAGLYRAMLESQDRFGKRVTAQRPLRVVKPDGEKFGLKIPHLLDSPSWQVEPGQEFMALWGTGYEAGRAFVEIEQRGRITQRFWTQKGRTQQQIKLAVTESMRGGLHVHVTQVREHRAYLVTRRIEVPWSNKELEMKWEHFVSKLQPGQKETWSLAIRPTRKADAGKPGNAAIEMAASLYDASLDQFLRHEWLSGFGVFRSDASLLTARFDNVQLDLQWLSGQWREDVTGVQVSYRQFPQELVMNWWGYGFPMKTMRRGAGMADGAVMLEAMPAAAPAPAMAIDSLATANAPRMLALGRATMTNSNVTLGLAGVPAPGAAPGGARSSAPSVDLSQVAARRNLNETAFFYPQLLADTNGEVRMTFTMPEALTTWRFLGFAHDKELKAGLLEAKAVTAKDLMVQPNPPRFVREGDELEFTVKVTNQSTNRQTGKVKLALRYAANDAPADRELKLAGLSGSGKAGGTELAFDIPGKESRTFSWRLEVPDGCGFLAYKAVGATGTLSDGEEGWLPVLSRRILVTESLPLPIRGKQGGGETVKKFEMGKLLKSGSSSTLRHQSYTVQMVSQPAWYAVMALPYLMEFPHECSEQTFNRFYANTLARQIALKDPKIRRVFDQWKGTAALDSPLEKNQELKSVMLEETPWVRQAAKESEARRNVGVLFDENRLASEQSATLRKLTDMQGADGLWPWFPGGRGSDYISLYIVTGFARLRHLGMDVDVKSAVKAIARLDEWMAERHREILKMTKPASYVPGPTECLYLYGRSFFLKDRPLAGGPKEAVEFFLARAREHWLEVGCRQNQGQLALALNRVGGEDNVKVARGIVRSLKERSVRDEEMGMFWRETELSWWWYRAPIETQAMMIEVFDEVAQDRDAVEECRVWLLKQKQTQDWKTTKATADAVFALLLRGGDLLGSDKLVEVSVGGVNVTPGRVGVPGTSQPEAGTGYYEKRFVAGEIKPAMGDIRLRKVDAGVSWGSVHWQYLEDMSKVSAYEGTPLKLKKVLFKRMNTARGPVLEAVKGALGVGDEVVVRLELRVDRDMEFVHLKDQRGSGLEPLNVLSGYRQQDGLRYYESTRDTASHFYIDYLPKGTYVFEYGSRVQQRGRYQAGMASIQCMYAPEFKSHSESPVLVVK